LATGIDPVTATRQLELQPILTARAVLNWRHLLVVSLFCALFLLACYVPMSSQGTWASIRSGREVLSSGWLLHADPVQPLAVGMPFLHVDWLSDTLVALIERTGGVEWLVNVKAILLLATYLLWGRTFFLLSQSKLVTLLGVLALTPCLWPLFHGLQSTNFGAVCLALFVWVFVEQGHWLRSDANANASWCLWIAPPMITALWANLSPAFILAPCLMALLLLDRVIQVWATDGWRRLFWDAQVRRHIYLFELVLLATCVHPLGLRIWSELLTSPSGALWLEFGPPQTTGMWTLNGLSLLAMWSIAAILWRVGDKALSPVVPLACILITVGIAARHSLSAWLMPVAIVLLIPNVSHAIKSCRGFIEREPTNPTLETSTPPRPLDFAGTLLCGLLIWLTFALSPVSSPLLSGQPRDTAQMVGGAPPNAAIGHLPAGTSAALVWSPAEWSDYISHATEAKVFAGSDLHRLPTQARFDYLQIAQGSAGLEERLIRYHVNTVIAHPREHATLLRQLTERKQTWTRVHGDAQAVVFVRSGATP
jgi:hypothetical protein